MRKRVTLCVSMLLAVSASANPDTFSRTVKLSKGEAKVEFTAQAPEGAHTGPLKDPHVGIAPSANPSFSAYLAQQLDESGKATVVPPSRLSTANSLSGGFDGMMRSDLQDTITAACRQGKLDYLLAMGAPQMSMKTDATTYIMGFGRSRMRNRQDAKLYDCRTRQAVWVQSVLFETSQGALSSAFTGNAAGGLLGGPDAERAMAKVYTEKLTADMNW